MTVDVFIGVFAALGCYMCLKVIATYASYQLLGFDVFDDTPEINVYINADLQTKDASEDAEEE
jgi:hypothetical protein